MMDLSNREWYSMSDLTLLRSLGEFVRKSRLSQNKTQSELATSAGINRSTLAQIEAGGGANLLSFIQVLRSLEQLEILRHFEVREEMSPLALAKQDQKKRQRARKNKDDDSKRTESDW
jgi:transcriptional regulator with XRE-family HTH domain